jgi:hypothetical protein
MTMLCPAEKTAQPPASVLHTAGAAAAPPQAVRIMLAAINTERITYKRFMDFSSKDLYFVEHYGLHKAYNRISRPGFLCCLGPPPFEKNLLF